MGTHESTPTPPSLKNKAVLNPHAHAQSTGTSRLKHRNAREHEPRGLLGWQRVRLRPRSRRLAAAALANTAWQNAPSETNRLCTKSARLGLRARRFTSRIRTT